MAIQKKPSAKSDENPPAKAKYDYGDKYKEKTKAFGRLKTALKKNDEAKAKWDEIEKLKGRDASKNMKKAMFLFAYQQGLESDGEAFGSTFWEEAEEIKTTDEKAIQGIWVTQGRGLNCLSGSKRLRR